MTEHRLPVLSQVNLVVNNLAASVTFYRTLGLTVENARQPEWVPHHATVVMPNGMRLEMDSAEFAKQWNRGLKDRLGGAGCVLFFDVSSAAAVDRLFGLLAANYAVQQAPRDAFWGARYAIVEDPDGNAVGFMSPIDAARRYAPPPPPGLAASG